MQQLKYLFIAGFLDGSTFLQPESDTSKILEGKSAFYDVLQRQDELETFTLFSVDPDKETGQRMIATVCLSNGSFQVNGSIFKMHDEKEFLKDFRLIFYRKHDHHINNKLVADGKGNWDVESQEEISHVTTYMMGWQATNHMGQNIQRIMQFK